MVIKAPLGNVDKSREWFKLITENGTDVQISVETVWQHSIDPGYLSRPEGLVMLLVDGKQVWTAWQSSLT